MKSKLKIIVLSNGTEPNPFVKIKFNKRIDKLLGCIEYITDQLFIERGIRYILSDVSIIAGENSVRCRMVGLFIKH